MIFFTGAPNPAFLKRSGVPMFVAMTALARYKTFPRRALAEDGLPGACAIDGGVFDYMSKHGTLPFGLEQYAGLARKACDTVGGVVRVASLDLMCEPGILEKSGKTVRDHQHISTDNLLTLRHMAPEVPWMLTVQGWEHDEYLEHVEHYRSCGVDLLDEPLVGLGSVCRRQNTAMAERLVRELVEAGLNLHLLGFKVAGLSRFADLLGDVYETRPPPHVRGRGRVVQYDTQADLMAARRRKLLHPDCARRLSETGRGHKNCASCLPFILMKREQRLAELAAAARASIHAPTQLSLFARSA